MQVQSLIAKKDNANALITVTKKTLFHPLFIFLCNVLLGIKLNWSIISIVFPPAVLVKEFWGIEILLDWFAD